MTDLDLAQSEGAREHAMSAWQCPRLPPNKVTLLKDTHKLDGSRMFQTIHARLSVFDENLKVSAGAPGFEPGIGGIKIGPTHSEISAHFHNSCDVHVIPVQGLISAVEAAEASVIPTQN
jgi:hypothetical protein